MKKQVLLTAVRPSGELTLGNYLGAIANYKKLSQEYAESYIFLADLHGITSPRNPKEVNESIRQSIAIYLACGIDPEKSIIFQQSAINEHAALGFIMAFQCKMGELNRMTQFKLKSAAQKDGVDVGLFIYPPLMIADILLYDTQVVPVGEDQRQHVELTRDMAIRFNKRYGETFTLPTCDVPRVGGKIMNLADPTRKMSKSDDADDKGTLFLLEDIAKIRKKVMGAQTDSLGCVKYDEEKQPGIANLMTIYSAITQKTYAQIEKEFEGKGYGVFKTVVADAVCELIGSIQKRYHEVNKPEMIQSLLSRGTKIAQQRAAQKLYEVKEKLGLIIQ